MTDTATWSSPPRHRQDGHRRSGLPRLCASRPTVRAAVRRPPDARSWSSRCAPTARCSATRRSGSCTSGAPGPRALAPCLRERPVPQLLRHREHPGRRLRHRGDRRVPPRRGGVLPADHRPPDARRAAGSDCHPRARRRRRRPRQFFDGRTAPSFGSGTRSGRTCLPFHYFAVADGTDLRGSAGHVVATTRPSCRNVYTGNNARAAIVLAAAAGQGPEPGSDARPRVLRQRRPRRLHGSLSPRPASQHSRSVAHTPRARAPARSGRPASRRRVNALFAVDLFNEGLTCPTSTPCSSCAQPRAPPSSSSSWAADSGAPATRPCSRSSTSSATRTSSSAGTRSFAHSPALHGAASNATSREGFPFLPSGCQIMLDKQAQSLVLENLSAQVANRWSPDRRGAPVVRRPRPRQLPRRVGHRAVRHPETWQPLLDPLRRDAGLPTAQGRIARRSCSSGSVPSPTSTTVSGPAVPQAC